MLKTQQNKTNLYFRLKNNDLRGLSKNIRIHFRKSRQLVRTRFSFDVAYWCFLLSINIVLYTLSWCVLDTSLIMYEGHDGH